VASRSFVSSEARQECAGREDAGCSEILHLPSSLSRARPDFLPTILAMVWGLTVCFGLDRSNYSSWRRVQWRMLGKLGKDCMGDLQRSTRRWRRRVWQTAWLTSQLFTCGGVNVVGRQFGFAHSRETGARDVETTRQLLWPLSWALGWPCARQPLDSLVPAPRRQPSPLLSQALTTDCIPPHNSSLLRHLALHPTSRSLP